MVETCKCGWPLPANPSINVSGRSAGKLTIICWYKCPNCLTDFNVGKEISEDILNYHGQSAAIEPRGVTVKELPVL